MSPPVDGRLLPAALGAWAAAGVGLALPAAATAVTGAGCLAVAGLLLIRCSSASTVRARLPARRPSVAIALAVVGISLFTTAAHLYARASGALAAATGGHAVVVATVVGEPRPLSTVQPWQLEPDHRVVVAAEEVRARGAVAPARGRVLLLGAVAELRLGERVEVRGQLAASDATDDVAAVLRVGDPPVVRAAPAGTLGAVGAIRAALREVADGLSPQARGLVPGIAVGDDRALPVDLESDMQTTGLTHLTAVSGAHVAILLGTVLAMTVWMPRWARIATGALTLAGFVALVRPEASVLRSSVMGAVVLLALILGRPARALPALCAAVVVLVVADPWLARSYGFALSVLATGGLVLLARPWAGWLSRALPRWLAHAIAVPAAAQAVCGPVVLLLAPALATYAVPANVLAAPAVPPATVLGVGAALLATWWPAGATVLATAASWCTAWVAGVATVGADLPGARTPWLGGAGGALALAALTAVGVLALWRTGPGPVRRLAAPVGALGAAALAVLALSRPGWPPPGWVAVQCDVGQGSALVVASGPGAAIVVDVGPATPDAAGCLGDLGVTQVDLLVLTHAHADHVGGLDHVLGVVTVHAALMGPGDGPGDARVVAALEDAGIPVSRPTAGATGGSGRVAWEVLWPTPRAAATLAGEDGVNDLSVVVRLRTGELDLVALGDVEHAGQRGLLARRHAPADVVVMAHHGSARQEPALAAALAPRLTLVGVGENDFGHPAPSALRTYAATGLVRRTDTCGDVAVVTRDGDLAAVCRADVAG